MLVEGSRRRLEAPADGVPETPENRRFCLLEIFQSGGWLMVPILLCSIVAAAICVERLWSLQRSRIVPKNLLAQIWSALKSSDLDSQKLRELRGNSPLGQILAAGILGLDVGLQTVQSQRVECVVLQ